MVFIGIGQINTTIASAYVNAKDIPYSVTYLEFLNNNFSSNDAKTVRFGFAYINNDNIPELVINLSDSTDEDSEYNAKIVGITSAASVTDITTFHHGSGQWLSYVEKKGILYEHYNEYNAQEIIRYDYDMKDFSLAGGFFTHQIFYTWAERKGDPSSRVEAFKVDYKEVSKSKYNSIYNEYFNEKETIPSSTTMSYNELVSKLKSIPIKTTLQNTSIEVRLNGFKLATQSYSIIYDGVRKGIKAQYLKTGKTSKKQCKKYVKVSSKGMLTIKKGIKKGTYRVKVTVPAQGRYKKTTKTIKIVIK